jgi:DeoR/GlpR family transcriptional regulator of sugar metabolism
MREESLELNARRKRIKDMLEHGGIVRVSHLSEMFGVSVVTVRADLSALEREGCLERTQGGAVQAKKSIYNSVFLNRKHENSEIKRLIAAKAASMVEDGETLLINSGTTTYLTAIELKQRKNLNIVTNSIHIAMELDAHPTFRVILLGGEINSQYAFTHGNDALEQLSRYKADKAILSIDGISSSANLSTYHAEEAIVDRVMCERSWQTLIVADSGKLGRDSFSFVTRMQGAFCVVTDRRAGQDVLGALERGGVAVESVLS